MHISLVGAHRAMSSCAKTQPDSMSRMVTISAASLGDRRAVESPTSGSMSADGWDRALESHPTRLLQTEQTNIFAESTYEDPAEFEHRTGSTVGLSLCASSAKTYTSACRVETLSWVFASGFHLRVFGVRKVTADSFR